jgi:hypothetical protein
MARKNFDWFLKGQWLCVNKAIYDHDVTYCYGMGLQISPISYIIKRFRYDNNISTFQAYSEVNIYSSYLNLVGNLDAYKVLYLPKNALV